MQETTRWIALVALIWSWATAPLAAEGADLARALERMRAADWDVALRLAGDEGSVGRDIVEWHRLRAGLGDAGEALAFLDRRPDWPGVDYLREKSEPAIAAAGRDAVIDFFAEMGPQTADGVLTEARALIAADRRGEAEANLVLAWRTMAMSAGTQASFLAGHGDLLAPHHAARIDRLLWEDHLSSARRMLDLVDKDQRALAVARIALKETSPGVDALIEAVPDSLRSAPGLAFDRFAWRDRKGRDADAIALLLSRSTSAESLGEPGRWARPRLSLAEQRMRAGDAAQAYEIAATHHTTADIGYTHAALEWLAGYLALGPLGDPAAALEHFRRFDAAVETPISKGRGYYWIGRAHEALGDAEAARDAWVKGGAHQTSFYGLLSAERAGLPFDPALANPPALPPWREAAFMSSSVLQAGLALLAADEPVLAERFLTHLVEGLDETAAAQLGAMAVEMGRAHLAVMISKRAAQRGIVLAGAYYPVHPVGEMALPMAPEMTLAIARRESEFDPGVISGAGARGLMQVMPATAQAVASDLGIRAAHATERLISDWRYNAKLGANYLAQLARDLGGNVVMMSAGYNAGPGRPLRWMASFGDPRSATPPESDAEIVAWIEAIPFDETRNYVMRVTESLPVYRARLGLDPLPIPFSHELTGATLLSYAAP